MSRYTLDGILLLLLLLGLFLDFLDLFNRGSLLLLFFENFALNVQHGVVHVHGRLKLRRISLLIVVDG